MLRFGILGAGRIGKVHARTIAASGKAKVAYLADAMPKAAADLAGEVGAKVASVEEIIKAKDVDAILIATPTPRGVHVCTQRSPGTGCVTVGLASLRISTA